MDQSARRMSAMRLVGNVLMPRSVVSLTDWRAVAHEMAEAHTALAPPGLTERIQALLAQAPREWPEQELAFALDESCALAIRASQARLAGDDPAAGHQAASVAEALHMIRDHRQHR